MSLPRALSILCSIALLVSNLSIVAASSDRTSNKQVITQQQQVLPPEGGKEVSTYETNRGGDGNTTAPRPFYVIAHRVLTSQGVRDAIAHGANAMEMDMTAWKKTGWFADHDGTLISAGDSAHEIFLAIAAERQAGKTMTVVWLDIKNPDYCDPDDLKWRHCSIDGLRDLTRGILEPWGVRVLYGFYNPESKAFGRIRNDLNANEAINLNGGVEEVEAGFDAVGPHQQLEVSKRVMSYGSFNLPFKFGDCQEDGYYNCAELQKAVVASERPRDCGRSFGKVFGWTSSAGQSSYVDKLLGDAGVDGLIYGFRATHYYDHEDTRSAARNILEWIEGHSDRRYIAKQEDKPW